jgi:hypothetical protein
MDEELPPHPPDYWLGKTLRRGSDDSSDGWMTLQLCKQKCKHPSTHKPRFKLGGDAGCPSVSPRLSHSIPSFSSYLVTYLVGCTIAVILEMAMGTRDPRPVGFSSIRRRVWAKFCTHGFVSGTNVIPNGFAGPGLVFLNLDPLPM